MYTGSELKKKVYCKNYAELIECVCCEQSEALQSQLKESEERLAKAEELNRVYESALEKLRVAVEDKGPDKGAVRFIDQALAAKTQNEKGAR